MIALRIWLASRLLWLSTLFLRSATRVAPSTEPEPDEMFADLAEDAEEHGEAYDAPYHLRHFHRPKGGVVSLRPMNDETEGSE